MIEEPKFEGNKAQVSWAFDYQLCCCCWRLKAIGTNYYEFAIEEDRLVISYVKTVMQ